MFTEELRHKKMNLSTVPLRPGFHKLYESCSPLYPHFTAQNVRHLPNEWYVFSWLSLYCQLQLLFKESFSLRATGATGVTLEITNSAGSESGWCSKATLSAPTLLLLCLTIYKPPCGELLPISPLHTARLTEKRPLAVELGPN